VQGENISVQNPAQMCLCVKKYREMRTDMTLIKMPQKMTNSQKTIDYTKNDGIIVFGSKK
jgi:hypothetical protein